METTSDRGRVTSEIMVVRTLARKRNSTMTTKIPPSMSDFCTLPIELSIKRLWRKMSVETFTSGGRFFCKSFSEASSLAVSSRVLVAGCFVTVSSTAGLPRSEARPNLGVCAPMRTSATSSNKIGSDELLPLPLVACSSSLVALTTVFPSNSVFVVAVSPRTMYSLPYS